ncbi:response regulator [Candidatus Saccharibacteria bacterium]|nr:response regulator [Candidatus Saccharibacteria bacterium]
MKNKNILIVEDDKDILYLYAFKLRAKGFDVRTAENGQEGLNECYKLTPDLILVDLFMPVMDGVALISKLRAEQKFAHLPIVVLTNVNKAEAPHELRFMRIESYVLKAHTTPTQLASIVHGLLT